MILGFLIRILYAVVWVVLGLLVLPIACYKKRDKLWGWAYYFDNDEDGFDGDRLGWYSNYLGKAISKSKPWYRTFVSYKWSAWRNSCFNLRNHPWVGVDITKPTDIKYRGNTYFHTRKWHYDKTETGMLWYWITATYGTGRHNSLFFLMPIPFTKRDLYVRFGLKIYPRNYFDEYWLKRIADEGWPKAKDKGLPAISIRIRKNPLHQ